MKRLNLIKTFGAFLFLFICLFGIKMPTVNAEAAPASFTYANPIPIGYYLGTIHFNYKQTTTGQIVYCTEFVKTSPSGGSYFTKVGELDAGFAYIMANGYPNKKFTGDNYKDFYITQLAVWWYLDEAKGISSSVTSRLKNGTYDSNSMTTYIRNLKNGAVAAYKNGYTKPSIKLSTNGVDLKVAADKKYYVSQAISVKTNSVAGNYTVKLASAPSGAIITDTSGNTKSTFAQNESFFVKVPTSSITKNNLKNTINLSVSATGSVGKVYEYKTTASGVQKVVPAMLYPETSNVGDSLSLTLNSTAVKISKQDIANKKELAGATLIVKDANGNQIDKWTSTEEAHYLYNLASGTYYLTEITAPNKYKLSTETVKFTVNNDGSVQSVVMFNTKKDDTIVKISKQDITSKQEIAGAKLIIKDSKGKEVASWTSTTEPYYLTLEPGKYTLEEITAPDGYVLSKEVIEFEVEEDGNVKTVIMYNEPIAEHVVVPITSSSSTLIYGLSIALIIGGLGFVYYYKKIKQQG